MITALHRLTTAPACAALLLISLLMSACAQPEPEEAATANTIPVESKADSVAMTVYEAFGGPEAWGSLPYLRFDFAGGNDSVRTVRGRHLWDRMTGRYRVEMPVNDDTVYVALFNVNSREGEVYLNGAPVDSTRKTRLLDQAYTRYINDMYWLLMPVKMFDPGVTRLYEADSSDSETDVLRLSFDSVGLTPGDQYWVYVDKATGRVKAWAYRLQHHPADFVPQPVEWTGYKTLQAPEGEILVSERKVRPGGVTFTDNVAAPAEVDDAAFTDPNPRLAGS